MLDFIDFLQFKLQKQELKEEEKEAISVYEAAKEFAGCVDFGPGDLATNKEYLRLFRRCYAKLQNKIRYFPLKSRVLGS